MTQDTRLKQLLALLLALLLAVAATVVTAVDALLGRPADPVEGAAAIDDHCLAKHASQPRASTKQRQQRLQRLQSADEQVPKGPRSFYKPGEAAMVRWDANDRLDLPEPASDGVVELKKKKWNKDSEGAWRKDLGA